MLDTNEVFFDHAIDLTFVDPYPQLLESLIRPEDKERHKIIPSTAQALPLTLFDQLEANDILFIDSSHVSKAGSDVNVLFFDVLPRLKPGVVVHVHDIIYPLEQPLEWLKEGRFWNEQYLLRAFLMYNHSFELLTISGQLVRAHDEWLKEHMPGLLKVGGCLWMQRVK